MENSLNFLFFLNSSLLILLILNQNESAKDSATTQTSSSSLNPLEQITWISLFLNFLLLLWKAKSTE